MTFKFPDGYDDTPEIIIDRLRAELAAVVKLHAADMARKDAEVKALRDNCVLLQDELAVLAAPQPCGHAGRYRYQDGDGAGEESCALCDLADMTKQWAADVGSAVARAQTAEDAQRRAERDLAASNKMIDELAAHTSELEARTDPYPQEDLVRLIEQHRAAARKVAQYAAQATASMGALEEQVTDARAEAARLRELLADIAGAAMRGPAQSDPLADVTSPALRRFASEKPAARRQEANDDTE